MNKALGCYGVLLKKKAFKKASSFVHGHELLIC